MPGKKRRPLDLGGFTDKALKLLVGGLIAERGKRAAIELDVERLGIRHDPIEIKQRAFGMNQLLDQRHSPHTGDHH